MFIYQITNKINGKRYIGKTTKKSIFDRWKTHLSDCKKSNTKLYNAIRKYGEVNFSIDVFEQTGKVSTEKLNERERYWIEVLEPEYNMTKGGDGGWIHDQTGNRWKIKNTSNMKGKKTVTDKVKQGWLKNSDKNNYQSKYKIHTPWGCFFTWKAAIIEAKRLKQNGCIKVLTNTHTLQQYCLQNILLNKEGRRTVPDWRGKYTKDLGFFVENKVE
jgi:group I intron endonuclease